MKYDELKDTDVLVLNLGDAQIRFSKDVMDMFLKSSDAILSFDPLNIFNNGTEYFELFCPKYAGYVTIEHN